MKKIYYLKTCDTCKKIISQINNLERFELQNIKENPVTESQLNDLKTLSGSYETLFNKRAQLYKQLELKDKNLQEVDYQKYLLEHYTFLARPVILFDNQIFIGNSTKIIEKMLAVVNK